MMTKEKIEQSYQNGHRNFSCEDMTDADLIEVILTGVILTRSRHDKGRHERGRLDRDRLESRYEQEGDA